MARSLSDELSFLKIQVLSSMMNVVLFFTESPILLLSDRLIWRVCAESDGVYLNRLTNEILLTA